MVLTFCCLLFVLIRQGLRGGSGFCERRSTSSPLLLPLSRSDITQPLAALEAGSGTCAVLIWYDTGTDLARADLTAPTLLAPLQAGGAAAFGGGAALIAAAPSLFQCHTRLAPHPPLSPCRINTKSKHQKVSTTTSRPSPYSA